LRRSFSFIGKPTDVTTIRLTKSGHALCWICRRHIAKCCGRVFPGYARAFREVGKERGWAPVTRADFDAQLGPNTALLVGDPKQVANKIIRHSKELNHDNNRPVPRLVA
jgi:hypothetical protein